MTPKDLRENIAKNEFNQTTAGMCKGYLQANMLLLPKEYAHSFEKFAKANAKAIPILEILKESPYSKVLAKGANVLNQIPSYNILKNGKIVETSNNIEKYYTKDMVIYLIGCSFTFETPLIKAGISLRHIEEGLNVSMYKSNIKLNPVDNFHGSMVVSMRPVAKDRVADACVITSHYPSVHGSPIHVGYPSMIGIKDISRPDYGDAVLIKKDEIPIFWPCGVSCENVIKGLKLPFAITHSPGYMFVSDKKDSEYYV